MAFNDKKTLSGDIQKIALVMQKSDQEPNRTSALGLVDTLLSIFVVTPLVIFCWRGSWGFMDLHAKYFPNLSCFLIGMIIHVSLAVGQDSLHAAIISSDKHWGLKIIFHFARRLYTYVFFTATILHWKGGWGLIDLLTSLKLRSNGVVIAEGSHWFLILCTSTFLLLIALKGLRNSIAPPFAICIDKSNYVFLFPTMFRRKCQKSVFLTALDAFFSVAIMGNLVVIFWRGAWVIIDILLIPEDFKFSSWSSLVLGLLSVGLVFRLEKTMKCSCSVYTGWRKIVIADCYITLCCIATLLYWRGVWSLINIYFLPDDVQLSCLLSHFVGFTALVVINCSNSLLVRGIYKDGKESNGDCVIFPCHYLRIILDVEDSYASEVVDSNFDSEKRILSKPDPDIV
ncbi:uncharacterized protein [Euwallacea fornicatus]|uniref:uncharacterized protein n=1 Tax=Euwallacea fornicatus TaxID=995702 RepID=UPI00338D473C